MNAATQTKTDRARERRRLKAACRRDALRVWLNNASEWLIRNRATVDEAAGFAVEDGLTWVRPRMISLAWPGEYRPAPMRDKRTALSKPQWQRLERAIRARAEPLRSMYSVAAAAQLLEAECRIRRPLAAIESALCSVGICIPFREPRPKFC